MASIRASEHHCWMPVGQKCTLTRSSSISRAITSTSATCSSGASTGRSKRRRISSPIAGSKWRSTAASGPWARRLRSRMGTEKASPYADIARAARAQATAYLVEQSRRRMRYVEVNSRADAALRHAGIRDAGHQIGIGGRRVVHGGQPHLERLVGGAEAYIGNAAAVIMAVGQCRHNESSRLGRRRIGNLDDGVALPGKRLAFGQRRIGIGEQPGCGNAI